MTHTYEMIRAIPAKGFDWAGFTAALRAKVIAVYSNGSLTASGTLAGWDAAKGMRGVRNAAMEMAAFYTDKVSKRSNVIAPSSESRMWDSFEGGHHDVWNDAEAKEAAVAEIAALIPQFRG